MKKKFAMLLAVVMTLLSACTGGLSSSTTSPGQAGTATPGNASAQPISGETVQFDPTATIEETILVDENDVKITATEIKYTAYDVKLSLVIENNSSQNLSFHSNTWTYGCNSVNGYMVDDGYLNADVAAGKKSNETVSISVDWLTMLGCSDIADIELGFRINDDDRNEYLLTGPRQLKTSIADSYDYETDTYRQAITSNALGSTLGFTLDCDSEEVVFDQKGIRVVSQTLAVNPSGEHVLLVEVENVSSDMIYVSVGDVAINGLCIEDGTWSTDWISAGKRRIMTVDMSSLLDESYWAIFGLEEIGQITYSFEPKDSDLDTLVLPQTLTLTVPGGKASYNSSGEALYQGDGIRIVSKGLMPDPFEYSDDIHLLLLVENNSSEKLSFDVADDSLSINGYMTDFICYRRTVPPGGAAVLDVELMERDLEENGITGLEDISDLELTIEVRNNDYKTVAKPMVTVKVK